MPVMIGGGLSGFMTTSPAKGTTFNVQDDFSIQIFDRCFYEETSKPNSINLFCILKKPLQLRYSENIID